MNSAGKIAVVTGASSGLGRAVAREFRRRGFTVIALCRHAPEADTADRFLAVDLTDAEQRTRAAAAIEQEFGRLDVLVNNAGISYIGLLTDMSIEEWQNVINTNLSSCFYTSRLAIPLMLQKHSGRIINISSVWGNVGASMEVAYSASKGGVNSFTKALAKELAPSNIQVNAISCGVIDTAMNHCFSPEEMDALRQEIPADRLGQPEEVAKLVLQLIQAPTYLTGQILTLDGGWQ